MSEHRDGERRGEREQEEEGQGEKRGIPVLVIVDGNLVMALGQQLETFLVNRMD